MKEFPYKDWILECPDAGYEFLSNEDKVILNYNDNKIAVFRFLPDRVLVESDRCCFSFHDKTVAVASKNDPLGGVI